MAETTLTVTPCNRVEQAVEDTLVAWNADGMKFKNSSGNRVFLMIKNAHTVAQALAVTVQKTVDGLVVTDLAITLAASKTTIIGPFNEDYYNDTDYFVHIEAAALTSVTITAFSLATS